MRVLPSRCLRCGAASREPLCRSCVDYLVAYHPLWLDPSLLPGPSLLDALAPREAAVISSDLERIEWRTVSREPTDRDAVRLVGLLSLDADARPTMSVGDAEVLHGFLGRARRGAVADPSARRAVAALYRYLSTRDWMPRHLAAEYGLRARVLEPPLPVSPTEEEITHEVEELATKEKEIFPPLEAPSTAAVESATPGTEAPEPEAKEPAAGIPGPLPEPEGPLPAPPATEVQEAAHDEAVVLPAPRAEVPSVPIPTEEDRRAIEEVRRELERERQRVEDWVRARGEDFEAKERALAEREKALQAKEVEVEEHERAVTERLVAVEKDAARRDVLRFLGTIPGMTEQVADVIATAFPDMKSLEAADGKALLQCRGVTEAQALAIRHELVPGEVEEEQRAIDLREEAQGFMEEGDYEAALACYDRLLRERPEDTALWFDKAELEILLDRPEEALQCYNRVLDLDRRNRQAWFERANLLFGLGRLADAFDSLREALRIDPTKSADIILKAEELRRDGRPNDAAVLLQAVLDVDPKNQRAILAFGDTLMDLGDVDAAEGYFTRALGKDPQNPNILFRKGQLLDRKGRWGAAIQFINRAIALESTFIEPWLAKGRILLVHERGKEALECFDHVVSLDSDRVEAWLGKAEAHGVLGQREDAWNAIDEAAGREPGHPALPGLRERLRTMPEAKPPAEPPSLADVLEELGEEIEEGPEPKGPPRPAAPNMKSFVESIEAEKEDIHVLLQLAELALEGGDAQMALVRYTEAVEREPRNADARTGKGVALQYLERYDEALKAYDEALRLDPDHDLAKKWRQTCLRHVERGGSP